MNMRNIHGHEKISIGNAITR